MNASPNKKKSSLKTLLIILGAVVVIFAIVMFIGSRSSDPEPTTGLVTQSSGGGQVSSGSLADSDTATRRSDELVALLQSISSITLDDSIFRNPAFAALRDLNSTLPLDRDPGRSNPFLPIGSDTQAATSSVFQTDQNVSAVSTGNTALDSFINTGTEQ